MDRDDHIKRGTLSLKDASLRWKSKYDIKYIMIITERGSLGVWSTVGTITT